MAEKTRKLLVAGIPLTTLIGIVACFGDDAVGASINPALASIGAAFPDVPCAQILWLYSMPKVVIVPLTLVAGLVTGRYISYRTAAIVGFALIAAGGVAPVFLNDFWAILASRFVLGAGLAIQAPIGPALVLRYFADPRRRATVLGIGHGFVNVYGVLTNVLVGGLCAIDWHYAFLAYGTIVILLVLAVLFVRDPPEGEGVEGADGMPAGALLAEQQRRAHMDGADMESKGGIAAIGAPSRAGQRGFSVPSAWARMPGGAYGLIAAYLVTLVLWGTAGLNLSAVIQANGFGDAAVSGVVISLINLSGVISGFAFELIARAFGRYVLPFGMFLMAAGFGAYCLAPNVYVLAAGVFVAGLANTVIMTGFENAVGARCDAALISLGMSLCMVASQLSGFLCPFYIAFIMDVLGFASFTAPVAISAVLLCVLGLAFSVGARCSVRASDE